MKPGGPSIVIPSAASSPLSYSPPEETPGPSALTRNLEKTSEGECSTSSRSSGNLAYAASVSEMTSLFEVPQTRTGPSRATLGAASREPTELAVAQLEIKELRTRLDRTETEQKEVMKRLDAIKNLMERRNPYV